MKQFLPFIGNVVLYSFKVIFHSGRKTPVAENSIIDQAKYVEKMQTTTQIISMAEVSKIKILSFPSKTAHVADLGWAAFGFHCWPIKKKKRPRKKQ